MRSILLVLAVIVAAFSTTSALNVICYYESWGGAYTPEDIDVSICTHINYAFMGINGDGSLRLDGDDGVIKRLVALKSRNPNLKVLLSVGGWSEGSTGFSSVAADAGKKANMAQSTMWYINTYNLDGLDIDWEYPGQRGGNPADKENFIDMLWVIRNAFNANGGNHLLTIASSSEPSGDSYNTQAISKVVDSINVMTYDFHGSYEGKTGQNSPLYASSSDSQWERDNSNVDASIRNWMNAGASSDKIAMGMGFYGHGFQLSDGNNHGVNAPTSGEGSYGYANYDVICTLNDGWTEVWDDEQQVPYKYNAGSRNWIGYDNARSIGLKVQYAKSHNLGGVMIWAVDNDDKNGACGPQNPLLDAIRDNL